MAEKLPQKIIDENILPRLPVKSLLRFTAVSKHWRSVILHPSFAKLQLQTTSKSHRIFVNSDGFPEFRSLNMVSSWFGESPLCCRKLHLPFAENLSFVWDLLGSCNGLVFFSLKAGVAFFVWNPSTGRYRRLPDIMHPRDVRAELVYYGVGYLRDEDDYRVVMGYSVQENVGGSEVVEMVYMFSTGEFGWRIIDGVNFVGLFLPGHHGKLSNQALHWLYSTDTRCYIVAFDLSQENFRSMELPGLVLENQVSYRLTLGVVGGCLCVSVYNINVYDIVDFWVMREYGAWTKSYTLDFSNLPADPLFNNAPCCWSSLESGTFVLKWVGNGFWFVRIDREEEEKLGVYMIRGSKSLMIDYEESLIWIEQKENVKKTKTSALKRVKDIALKTFSCLGGCYGSG